MSTRPSWKTITFRKKSTGPSTPFHLIFRSQRGEGAARCQEPVRLTTVLLRNRGDRPALPLDLVQDRPTIRLDQAKNPISVLRSLATNGQAGQAPRHVRAGIGRSLSNSRNKAGGCVLSRPKGGPQTRQGLAGRRGLPSFANCRNAAWRDWGLWEWITKVKWGTILF